MSFLSKSSNTPNNILVNISSKYKLVYVRIFHVGVYSVTGPIYSSEMSPTHLRGKLGVLNILFSTTGGMVSIIVAGLLSIHSGFAYSYGWR